MKSLAGLFSEIADIVPGMKLRTKFILSLSLLVLIPFTVFGMVSYRTSEKSIRDNVSSLALKNVTKISTDMDYYLRDIQSVTKIIFTDQELYKYFKSLKALPVNKRDYSGYKQLANSSSSYKIVTNILRLIGDRLSGIYFYDENYVYFVHPSYSYYLKENSETEDIWYKEALHSGSSMRIFVTQKTAPDSPGSQYTISLAQEIRDPDTLDTIGVIRIDLEYGRLRKLIDAEYGSSYAGNSLLIFDKENRKFYDNGSSFDTSSIFLAYNSSESGIDIRNIDKKEMYISYYTSPNTSWKIFSIIPADEVLSDLYRIKTTVIILTIACVLLILLISSLIASALLKPIYTLASAMENVEKGDFSTRVTLKSRDETRYLAESFNKMTSNIETLVNKVYNEELRRKDAELKSLQSQINPHFLYNTLESIRGVALANNLKSIASMAKSLSMLFRYSINSKDLVSFRDELQHLKNYMNIQNFRHEGKFQLILDLPDEVYAYSIPKLTLQPIVENSIKHGLEMRRGQGTISINASVSNGIVSIKVSDNGKGISPEKLSLLTRELSEGSRSDSGTGIGIRNVNSRVKLHFGEKYGLQLLEPEQGAEVEIILPAIVWKEQD